MICRLVTVGFFFTFVSLHLSAYSQNTSIFPWKEISPGGETLCARGEKFSFFVNEGSSDKIIIDFIGGGACWNDMTCNKSNPTFIDSVDYLRKKAEAGLEGLYDHSDSRNPLKDYTHVVIPYCTGDIHWGQKDTVYVDKLNKPYTIHHRGAINVKAVLRWVKKTYLLPQKIFVTGCSAGAYGSIYWLPKIKESYPTSIVSQLGDSGVGVITDDFNIQAKNVWNYMHNMPRWVPGIRDKINSNIRLVDFYLAIGEYYPNTRLSQFTTADDEVQKFFYELMGGEPEEWSKTTKYQLDTISNNSNNFSYYHTKGVEHCILPYDRMATTKQNNISFVNWLDAFVKDVAVDNVDCSDCISVKEN